MEMVGAEGDMQGREGSTSAGPWGLPGQQQEVADGGVSPTLGVPAAPGLF